MALATLADVKTYLDITTTDEDGRIPTLLAAAESQVIQYVSHDPEGGTRTDRVNGNSGVYMVPLGYPLLSVNSLTIDSIAIPAESGNKPGYYIMNGAVWLSGQYTFSRGIGNVVLSYQDGYSTIPAVFKKAVIELTATRLKEIERLGVSSKSVGTESISYAAKEMPASIKGYLDQFRKVF